MNYNHVYIIAEAGVNHNGSLVQAKKLIDAAAEAGADAVKFQTFKASALVSPMASKADYQLKSTNHTESQLDMLKRLELNENSHYELAAYCKHKGIAFLSTPFDSESLRLLVNQFDLPLIKIPSGEITNAPFLLEIAQTGKPVVLSTGMSTLGDIENALKVLAFGYIYKELTPGWKMFEEAYVSNQGQELLKNKVTLLHCTTEYPAPLEEVNLKAMNTLRVAFGLPVGYSDHTEGITIPIGATACGAVIIEKHFTLDRELPGPDHRASLEPGELKTMVNSIREIERALGNEKKLPTQSELKNRYVARKSLIALSNIKSTEKFTTSNLGVKRPGDGISPMYYWDMIGKKAEKDYTVNEKI